MDTAPQGNLFIKVDSVSNLGHGIQNVTSPLFLWTVDGPIETVIHIWLGVEDSYSTDKEIMGFAPKINLALCTLLNWYMNFNDEIHLM